MGFRLTAPVSGDFKCVEGDGHDPPTGCLEGLTQEIARPPTAASLSGTGHVVVAAGCNFATFRCQVTCPTIVRVSCSFEGSLKLGRVAGDQLPQDLELPRLRPGADVHNVALVAPVQAVGEDDGVVRDRLAGGDGRARRDCAVLRISRVSLRSLNALFPVNQPREGMKGKDQPSRQQHRSQSGCPRRQSCPPQ